MGRVAARDRDRRPRVTSCGRIRHRRRDKAGAGARECSCRRMVTGSRAASAVEGSPDLTEGLSNVDMASSTSSLEGLDQAAVDGVVGTGDVGGAVAGEEDDEVCDL